jgi:KaiC/GvpD/RAD55 family RecA-like ATPase
MSMAALIEFYKRCFELDQACSSIWAVEKLAENYQPLNECNEQLALGTVPRLAVLPSIAMPLREKVGRYQREKNLVYVPIFYQGDIIRRESGRVQKINAPLLSFDISIEQDEEHFFIRLNSSPQVNVELLKQLLTEEQAEQALDDFPLIEHLSISWLGEFSLWCQQYLPKTPALDLLSLPVLSEKKRDKKSPKRTGFYSQCALLLVDRRKATRGISHELELLMAKTEFSAPLKKLLLNEGGGKAEFSSLSEASLLPCQLNQAQEKALGIAATQTLGQITGPPGTGKSFTLAAVAVDRVLQGESVLIVTQTEQALDVIEEKLAQLFGAADHHVRIGEKAKLKAFKNQLQAWLAGQITQRTKEEFKQAKKRLKQCLSEHERSITLFQRRHQFAQKKGEKLERLMLKKGWFSDWRRQRLITKIQKKQTLAVHLDRLFAALKSKDDASAQLLLSQGYRLNDLLKQDRQSLSKFNEAIRARSSGKQQALFTQLDFKKLLTVFPVWMVSLDSLHRVLPLEKELFDVLLLDEATQCNIASCIPAFARAKRAVVAGDAKQLNHVAFTSQKQERHWQQQLNLNESWHSISYRNNSVLDKANQVLDSSDQLSFLDEHYRSHLGIIAFSNQQYYQNELKIMRQTPLCDVSEHQQFRHVAGVRDIKGVNVIEVAAVITELQCKIAEMKATGRDQTLGILSPFRDQIGALQKAVEKHISLEWVEKTQLKIATPYGFQGEERDIMLISMVINNDHKRAAVYLNKEDMFNVALTRAKHQQIIFHSNIDQIPASNQLRKLLAFDCVKQSSVKTENSEKRHFFYDEVLHYLADKQCRYWSNQVVAGVLVDILVLIKGQLWALDLAGVVIGATSVGQTQQLLSYSAYMQLQRAGINVYPLSYGQWLADDKQLSCVGLM